MVVGLPPAAPWLPPLLLLRWSVERRNLVCRCIEDVPGGGKKHESERPVSRQRSQGGLFL